MSESHIKENTSTKINWHASPCTGNHLEEYTHAVYQQNTKEQEIKERQLAILLQRDLLRGATLGATQTGLTSFVNHVFLAEKLACF